MSSKANDNRAYKGDTVMCYLGNYQTVMGIPWKLSDSDVLPWKLSDSDVLPWKLSDSDGYALEIIRRSSRELGLYCLFSISTVAKSCTEFLRNL